MIIYPDRTLVRKMLGEEGRCSVFLLFMVFSMPTSSSAWLGDDCCLWLFVDFIWNEAKFYNATVLIFKNSCLLYEIQRCFVWINYDQIPFPSFWRDAGPCVVPAPLFIRGAMRQLSIVNYLHNLRPQTLGIANVNFK